MFQYLEPIIGTRKSFYGKAIVRTFGNTKTLYSYNTKICTLRNNVLVFESFYISNTTIRHVKDFLYQYCPKIYYKAISYKSIKQFIIDNIGNAIRN